MRRQKKKKKTTEQVSEQFPSHSKHNRPPLIVQSLNTLPASLPPSPLLPWFPVIFTNSFFSFLFIPVCTHFSNIFFLPSLLSPSFLSSLFYRALLSFPSLLPHFPCLLLSVTPSHLLFILPFVCSFPSSLTPSPSCIDLNFLPPLSLPSFFLTFVHCPPFPLSPFFITELSPPSFLPFPIPPSPVTTLLPSPRSLIPLSHLLHFPSLLTSPSPSLLPLSSLPFHYLLLYLHPSSFLLSISPSLTTSPQTLYTSSSPSIAPRLGPYPLSIHPLGLFPSFPFVVPHFLLPNKSPVPPSPPSLSSSIHPSSPTPFSSSLLMPASTSFPVPLVCFIQLQIPAFHSNDLLLSIFIGQ